MTIPKRHRPISVGALQSPTSGLVRQYAKELDAAVRAKAIAELPMNKWQKEHARSAVWWHVKVAGFAERDLRRP